MEIQDKTHRYLIISDAIVIGHGLIRTNKNKTLR